MGFDATSMYDRLSECAIIVCVDSLKALTVLVCIIFVIVNINCNMWYIFRKHLFYFWPPQIQHKLTHFLLYTRLQELVTLLNLVNLEENHLNAVSTF